MAVLPASTDSDEMPSVAEPLALGLAVVHIPARTLPPTVVVTAGVDVAETPALALPPHLLHSAGGSDSDASLATGRDASLRRGDAGVRLATDSRTGGSGSGADLATNRCLANAGHGRCRADARLSCARRAHRGTGTDTAHAGRALRAETPGRRPAPTAP